MATLAFNTKENRWDDITKRKNEDRPTVEFDKNIHRESTITIPEKLIPKLERVKKDIANDNDALAICVGKPGSGKSTILRACCRYVSNDSFNPRLHMIRDVNDIAPVMRNARKGDSILIDEGSGIFGSTNTLTKETKYANLVLDVCRGKNLFICIAAPYFHKLVAQVAVERSVFLLRTYINKKTGKRGSVAYYKQTLKDRMYYELKKGELLAKFKPTWRGTFGADYQHEDLYQKMKSETLHAVLDKFDGGEKEKKETPQEIIRKYRMNLVRNNMDTPIRDIAKILTVSDRTVNRIKKEVLAEMSQENSDNSNIRGGVLLPTSDRGNQYITTHDSENNFGESGEEEDSTEEDSDEDYT